MTWTGQTFSVGQILTAAQQNNLQADITAQANGDSGAPKQVYAGMTFSNNIVQGDLAANCVGQSELKDALQQTSGTGSANISFTGGGYTLGWGMAGSGAGDVISTYFNTAYTWGIRYFDSNDYYFQARYFTATKPYNLGYGDIPIFIFAVIDKGTGKVDHISAAPDASWHYNGPTTIRADMYVKGVGYKLCRPVDIEVELLGGVDKVPLKDRENFTARMKEEQNSAYEITQDIKNADIDVVPHPFLGNDLAGKQVVLLDPCCNLSEELMYFMIAGENITDHFIKNRMVIDNTPLDVRSPKGVLTVPFKWKLTK